MTRYAIIIEKGERNYSAYCPDIPGVIAVSKTEEDTVELVTCLVDLPFDQFNLRAIYRFIVS